MSENNALTALRGREHVSRSASRGDWRGRSSQVATGDWEMLLRGVQSRLRAIVSVTAGANDASREGASLDRVDADVVACADDLDALQAALTAELGRCAHLERELVDVQAVLARSRAELADTRHGERRERHLALHDSLTGLPNRRCFGERLDQALTQVEPAHPGLVVLYIDLDGLKAINDRHGHDTGDELLRIVAARLRAALREQDVVSRLGGDEFACLLTDLLNREQLAHLACKLFDTVSAPMQIGECGLVVRASIGIATCPADGSTGAALLKHADTAMYCAKREQTGYAFFDKPTEGRVIQLATKTLAAPTSSPTNSSAPAMQ
ncbi:MAG TPA: GGDEF domain-containing protein [Burkholderiaceae bacterium]|nr:GGDEF domain-containing protein [Burkholderiaceae bacterium]